MRHFLSALTYLFFLFEVNCFAQKQSVAVDTLYIQTLVDSCKTLNAIGETNEALILGQGVLVKIEQFVKNADPKTQNSLKASKATTLRTIGNIYKDLFDLPNALEYYKHCLKIAKEINDQVNMGGALLNMGVVYENLHEYEKALDHLNQSADIFKQIGNVRGMALCFSNLGVVYRYLNQDSLALAFYDESMNMYKDLDDNNGAAWVLNNKADIYKGRRDFVEALDDYEFSFKMFEQVGDSSGMASSLAGIGEIHQAAHKDLRKAEQYFLRSLAIAKRFDLELAHGLINALKDLYYEQGNYKKAFEMYDQAILIKDSIASQQNAQEIMRTEMTSDFKEKEAAAKAETEKQAAIAEEESKRQKVMIWSAVGGLLLVMVFSVFMFNRWRLTQKQNRIIEAQKAEVETQKELADSRRIIAEEQKEVIEIQKAAVERAKHEVDEKNKDITDSINYAQRIQRAVLPHRKDILTAFPESFVLFRPKDIVSGDFYWASAGKEFFNIGCCDCTGHGVPGAFMSLLNISFLNQAVKERGITEPDKILNDVRVSIVRALNPDGKDERKDGMDAVLCSIDIKNKVLHAACANNPIWYIQGGELKEIKPDKMPVGSHTNMEVSFTKHSIQLAEGDSIYLFTDGYADQFGGPKNKKFRYKQLEDLLLANTLLPMKMQKDILEKAFVDWMGKYEQVDDVLIIGIRI